MIAPNIIGNESVKSYLENIISSGRLGSSYIFHGPAGVGKVSIAQAFAKAIVGGKDYSKGFHPDIHIYKPEGKLGVHTIDSLRSFVKEVSLPPHESDRKVFIIHNVERMLSYSANALLKTFEEPPGDTVIVLLCDHLENMLPTILSRCSKIAFYAISRDDIKKYLISNNSMVDEEANRISWLSSGSVSQALNIIDNGEDPSRGIILDFLAEDSFSDDRNIFNIVEAIKANYDSDAKASEIYERFSFFDRDTEQFLTAVQREAIEKELKGFMALYSIEYFSRLFNYILGWYRDLALLMSGADERLLFNPDYKDSLSANSHRSLPHSLDEIQRLIFEAERSLERSTKIENVLETLFFSLG